MKQLQTDDKVIIFGGYTNHPPCFNMEGLLVIDNYDCTNFFSNYNKVIDHKRLFTKIYLHDDRKELENSNIIKAYDGFFVVPPKNKSVSITVSGDHSWYKSSDEDGNQTPHISEQHVSKSWVTQRGLPIFRLEDTYKLFTQ
jgi:hypothetical protein